MITKKDWNWQKKRDKYMLKGGYSFLIFSPSYLLAIAGLLVFSSYRVEDGDNVGRTLCKIGCAGNWRLMDVHGVRVLKDREAARDTSMIRYSITHTAMAKRAEREVEVIMK